MITNDDLETRLHDSLEALPAGLRAHILRVENEARLLAQKHGVDEQRAALSALGHDLVRHLKGAELLAMATDYGLVPDSVEAASPILLHGPIAARILARDLEVDDGEILDGIDCHTTARPGMTALEQVLFIADKVEPHKVAREAVLGEVREVAHESLDAGTLRYLDFNIERSIERGWLLHRRSLEARNELLLRLGKAGAEA